MINLTDIAIIYAELMTQSESINFEHAIIPAVDVVAPPKLETRSDWGESLDALYSVDFTRLPKHIAFIMDGNRRWARSKNLHVLEGHRAGVSKAREVSDVCLDINAAAGFRAIEVLTFFAFSKENWNRSFSEVTGLMQIFENAAIREIYPLHERNIRVKIIGDKADLPASLVERIKKIEDLTKDNTALDANFCLSYSGRHDIINSIRRIKGAVDRGELQPDDIDEEVISKHLDTWEQPDPDLLIRTSGEMRFSNFLLWQIAYTELWVTPVYWPDFTNLNLIEAIREFQKRERRYGGGE